jgi:hypothetical protein
MLFLFVTAKDSSSNGSHVRPQKEELYMSVITGKGKQIGMAEETESLGQKMAKQLLDQFNQLHSIDNVKTDKGIEELLLKQMEHNISMIDAEPTYPKDVVKFNPSGASKPVMDLYLKAIGTKEKHTDKFPYHKRWTRNGSAIHDTVQKDLLYSEKYAPKPYFNVVRMESGLPAWEQNLLKWMQFEQNGYHFLINGMMDGILEYLPTGQKVGFEFKTKSTTIGQVGHYKMKDAQEEHKLQVVAYSLLFGLDDFIIMYESLAKDGWTKGAEAKPDIRAFHVHVTDEMREDLLDKFAYAVACKEHGIEPDDKTLGFFSGYKYLFEQEGEA